MIREQVCTDILSAFMLFSCFIQHFWTDGSIDRNKAMVEYLQQYGIIKSKKVAEGMEAIDRGLFVPAGSAPYVDSPMQIGYNATISAPHMHATCLELLKEHLQPGMHALDVGSGALLRHDLLLCFVIAFPCQFNDVLRH